MLQSKVLIGALVGALFITNAITGAMWWRSQNEVLHWQTETKTLFKQDDIASDENDSFRQPDNSPEIFRLLESDKTTRETTKIQDREIARDKKMYQACNGRKDADTSTQCVLRKNLQ
jgi:hypothetical protein